MRIYVDAGRDAVDIALINRCRTGDIVVTQDYGLAMFALSKGAAHRGTHPLRHG